MCSSSLTWASFTSLLPTFPILTHRHFPHLQFRFPDPILGTFGEEIQLQGDVTYEVGDYIARQWKVCRLSSCSSRRVDLVSYPLFYRPFCLVCPSCFSTSRHQPYAYTSHRKFPPTRSSSSTRMEDVNKLHSSVTLKKTIATRSPRKKKAMNNLSLQHLEEN